MKLFLFIVIFLGLTFLVIGFLSLFKLKTRSKIFRYNGHNSKFVISKPGYYNIAIEGSDFNEINENNLSIIQIKTNKEIEIIALGLRHKFFDDGKNFIEIFQVYMEENEEYELKIKNYSKLITHYSKYKIVEKYSVNKSPKIIIIENYSNEKRIKSILAIAVGLVLSFLGIAILFLGNY